MPYQTLAILAAGFALLYGLFTVGSPFLLALVTVIFLDPLIVLIMKYNKMGRMAAASIVCSLFVLLTLFLTYLIGLKIVTELGAFAANAPRYLNDANLYLQDASDRLYNALPGNIAEGLKGWLAGGFNTLTDTLKSLIAGFSSYVLNVAKTIPGLFIYLIVYTMAVYLFAFGVPSLKESFLGLFEPASRAKMDTVLGKLRGAVFGFLLSQIILSLLTYVMTLFGLLILGVDFPLAIALLIVVVEVLPILGTGSVLIPWAVYEYIAGSVFLGSGLVVMFLLISIVRRIIEPKVLGNAVGINALAALISMYVGFKLFGVMGLILGPVAVVVYQAMRKVGLLSFKFKLE